MVKNLKNFCNFFNSLLLHTAEHRLELPSPPCCCPPPFWLSPAFLLALPCFPKYFFLCLRWSVVLLFTSWVVLSPKVLLSALCLVCSTFSSWEKNPTFIYVMLRPKSLSPNRCCSWAPRASWPSPPKEATGTTSSVSPERLPHHSTRFCKGRSQSTFPDSSVSPLFTPYLTALLSAPATPDTSAFLQHVRLFRASQTFHMLLSLLYFVLLQAQLRCQLSQLKLVLQPLFFHDTWSCCCVDYNILSRMLKYP